MEAVADLVGADLRVLFCGINPGTLSGDLGLHFARPGNRFWKLLCAGGFTESVLKPAEQHTLPGLGIGITNLVGKLRPRCVVVLGLQAYRTAFLRTGAAIGRQPEFLSGATLWLLPNPSGLQARYQLPEMTEMYKEAFRAP
jgi:TDG/mug DNA glycosylase family protein